MEELKVTLTYREMLEIRSAIVILWSQVKDKYEGYKNDYSEDDWLVKVVKDDYKRALECMLIVENAMGYNSDDTREELEALKDDAG